MPYANESATSSDAVTTPIEEPYNPLALTELARSVEVALFSRDAIPLHQVSMFGGSGIYAIFYNGPLPVYLSITGKPTPIYVGKAIPEGARKGESGGVRRPQPPLRRRIMDHRLSVKRATNLDIADFSYRYLVTEEMFIGLAERMMINSLKPVWNRVVDGFGNHGQGSGRGDQMRSRWDTLHPGRPPALALPEHVLSCEEITAEVAAHFVANPPFEGEVHLPPTAAINYEDEAIS